jgi:HK97 family phage major capsid protein
MDPITNSDTPALDREAELRNEFSTIKAEWETFVGKSDLTPEQEAEQTKRFGRMEKIADALGQIRDVAGKAFEVATNDEEEEMAEATDEGEETPEEEGEKAYNRTAPTLPAPTVRKPRVDSFAIAPRIVTSKTRNAMAEEERKMFNRALLGDRKAAQKFTIDTTSGSGILVPTSVVQPFVTRKNRDKIREAIGARGYQVISSSQMVTINVPIFDDTANAAAVQSQSATSQTVLEPTTDGIELSPTLHTSKGIWLSNTMLNAPGFDVSSYLLPMLYKRIDLFREAAAFTEILASAAVGLVSAISDSLTYVEWINFKRSLSQEYREDAVLFASNDGMKLLETIVDLQDRPILKVNPLTQFQEIDGIPIFETANLPAQDVNAKPLVLASAECLKLYDAGPQRITRYVADKDKPDQTGFELFQNGDFGFASAGVRALQLGAASSNS